VIHVTANQSIFVRILGELLFSHPFLLYYFLAKKNMVPVVTQTIVPNPLEWNLEKLATS